MQDRNLKDGNSFGNTNTTGFECGVKLVRVFLPVGCHIVGQCDSALSWLYLFWYKSVWRNCHWDFLM